CRCRLWLPRPLPKLGGPRVVSRRCPRLKQRRRRRHRRHRRRRRQRRRHRR
ncbi:unnamed protein product, partial [Effrenium voratum]